MNTQNNLNILYEDNSIIICRKPAGTATQTRRSGQKDMESMLLSHVVSQGLPPYIGIIHRLDQPVEGVMVFAKNQKAAGALSLQVRDHTMEKYYYALATLPDGKDFSAATGLPADGTLTDYLSFDKKSNTAAIVSAGRKDSKKAVLDYRVVSEHDGAACLLIRLHTGRHHQIRVQLAHIGTPICGDSKYGTGTASALALCSCRIVFSHPEDGRKMDYTICPCNPLFEGFPVSLQTCKK